jgi:hypothetical protein
MSKIYVANILSRHFTYLTKKLNKMAGPQLLLPQPKTRLCSQQCLKYRGWSTNYCGLMMAALLQ